MSTVVRKIIVDSRAFLNNAPAQSGTFELPLQDVHGVVCRVDAEPRGHAMKGLQVQGLVAVQLNDLRKLKCPRLRRSVVQERPAVDDDLANNRAHFN